MNCMACMVCKKTRAAYTIFNADQHRTIMVCGKCEVATARQMSKDKTQYLVASISVLAGERHGKLKLRGYSDAWLNSLGKEYEPTGGTDLGS